MTEKIILTQIINALRYHENSGELLFERTNTGVIPAGSYTNKLGITKKRVVKTGRKGSSDIKVYCKNGITLHLEVKADKGKQNTNQSEWQEKLERLGHGYYVVKSVGEVERILEEVKK